MANKHNKMTPQTVLSSAHFVWGVISALQYSMDFFLSFWLFILLILYFYSISKIFFWNSDVAFFCFSAFVQQILEDFLWNFSSKTIAICYRFAFCFYRFDKENFFCFAMVYWSYAAIAVLDRHLFYSFFIGFILFSAFLSIFFSIFIFCLPSLFHVGLYPFFISCSAFFKSFLESKWIFVSQYIGLILMERVSFLLFTLSTLDYPFHPSWFTASAFLSSFQELSGQPTFLWYFWHPSNRVCFLFPVMIFNQYIGVFLFVFGGCPVSLYKIQSEVLHRNLLYFVKVNQIIGVSLFWRLFFVSGFFKILTSDFYFFLWHLTYLYCFLCENDIT